MFSIVIPTFQHYDNVVECLEAIHSYTCGDYEIIIIDNGSEPRGYVWAANRGLESAKGDPIVVMNDDIVVQADWIEPILDALDNDKDLWVCAPTVWPEPSCAIGPCNVWTREAYECIGGFDTKFIHWAADGRLIEDVHAHKKSVGIISDSHVKHIGNISYVNNKILREWHRHDIGNYPTSW